MNIEQRLYSYDRACAVDSSYGVVFIINNMELLKCRLWAWPKFSLTLKLIYMNFLTTLNIDLQVIFSACSAVQG